MHLKTSITTFALFLMCLSPALAQNKTDAAALAKTIAPWVNEQTVLVGHLDLDRVDLTTIEKFLLANLPDAKAAKFDPDQMKKDITAGFALTNTWLAAMRKAGGTHIFIVGTLAGFPQDPGFITIPINEGADANAIQSLLLNGTVDGPVDNVANPPKAGSSAPTTTLLNKSIIYAMPSMITLLKDFKPAPRADIASAFELSEGGTAQILFVPTDTTRKVFSEMLPALPREIGGGSTAPLLDGIKHWAFTAQTGKDFSFRLTAQATDAPSALAAQRTLSQAITMAHNRIEQEVNNNPEIKTFIGDLGALAKALTPTAEGDRLLLNLDVNQTGRMLAMLMPALAQARMQATQVQSMSQMRQIVMACHIYSEANQGKFPPDLQSALKAAGLPAQFLRNPMLPAKEIGYVYIQPVNLRDDHATLIVIHEAFDIIPERLSVGFADGHCETMTKADFEKALAQTKERNGGK